MSREGLELARLAQARGRARSCSRRSAGIEPRAIAALEPSPARKAVEPGGVGPAIDRAAAAVAGGASCSHLADAVLPNSHAEAGQLVRLFGVAAERIRVVPNGVLPSFGTASPEPFRERWGADPFVLYVGRIEPRKNMLGLVRAVGGAGAAAGRASASRRRATTTMPGVPARRRGARSSWLGRLDHDDPLLASAYAAARVFALPSWFETPGLAALEAALAGCAVVITPVRLDPRVLRRPGRRTPGPIGPSEIRRALRTCWDDGPDPGWRARVATHYLWPNVAQITAEVYDQVAR